jgi:hypothetical protein
VPSCQLPGFAPLNAPLFDYVFRAVVADNSSDQFLQQWIATSVKLYSDVVQVMSLLFCMFRALRIECNAQVKVDKNRKVVVQDNSILARVDDAITFRLLHRYAHASSSRHAFFF